MKRLGVMFSRQWWWVSLLVLVAIGVMARLGVWQLERLQARRAFNARVLDQQAQPPLVLAGDALQADLYGMEYRRVEVQGEYDHAQQVALRNQSWNDQAGMHLLTPLVIAGAQQAVLVDRGWIPLADAAPDRWSQYDEPGLVTVRGILRRPQARPDFGGVPDPEGVLTAWNVVNLERIRQQVSVPLLGAYVQQAPEPGWERLPHRYQPTLELTEGPHLGYAGQWFLFALVLALGYPRYVLSQTRSGGG